MRFSLFQQYSDEPIADLQSDIVLDIAELLEETGSVLRVNNMEQQKVAPAYSNELAQNYPNPFNPTTTIAFSLAKSAKVELLIYNVQGQLIRALVRDLHTSGVYKAVWDGRDNDGNAVASGVYFYRLRAGDFQATKKMVLLK